MADQIREALERALLNLLDLPCGTSLVSEAEIDRRVRLRDDAIERISAALALHAAGTDAPRNYPILVVTALIIRDGKVLLERHAPSYGNVGFFWDIPGGKVEFGEEPHDAVIREIREEMGVTVEPVRLLPRLDASIWQDKVAKHWILATYECRIVEGEPVVTDELQWREIASLDESFVKTPDLEIIRSVDLHHAGAQPDPTAERIAHLQTLADGWNGRYSVPITEAAIEAAEAVVRSLGQLTPCSNGGVQIDWPRAEIAFGPDGEQEFDDEAQDTARLESLFALVKESPLGNIEIFWDDEDPIQPWAVGVPGKGTHVFYDADTPRAAIDDAIAGGTKDA